MNRETTPTAETLETAHVRFGLDCLFSAQSELLEMAWRGIGTRFLFASSLYCAYGLDGLYTGPERGHAWFLSRILPCLLGRGFAYVHFGAADATIETLARWSRELGPLLVPVNLRHHPRFRGYGVRDFPFPLLVLGHQRDGFVTRDNLDRDEGSPLRPFRDSLVPAGQLDEMVRSYADAGLSLEWMSGAPGRWVLHVTPERSCTAPKDGGDEETARWITGLYRCANPAAAASTGDWLESRHWAAITATANGGAVEPESRIKRYLQEVKFAAVHLEILLRAVAALAPDVAEALRGSVRRAQERKHALRTRLLVDSMAGRLAEDLQRPQQAELLEIDPALRREMVAHLGELDPEPPA